MIAYSTGPVPDRIAIKITHQYCFNIGKHTFIMMNSFPDLFNILSVFIMRIIGPNSKEIKIKIFPLNRNGYDQLHILVVIIEHLKPKIGVREYTESFVLILPKP